eukprot:NODE_13624_length_1156_cov_2.204082.p4 GENE.NODE_13624_length_1156_cov_2.204082~~NODE_13624_length_1156_cov_2.204082.p4  ORF type:complete len:63 (+),score=3.92 NODE_13624_length_1156_cov_2.204082:514-702(+)
MCWERMAIAMRRHAIATTGASGAFAKPLTICVDSLRPVMRADATIKRRLMQLSAREIISSGS